MLKRILINNNMYKDKAQGGAAASAHGSRQDREAACGRTLGATQPDRTKSGHRGAGFCLR